MGWYMLWFVERGGSVRNFPCMGRETGCTVMCTHTCGDTADTTIHTIHEEGGTPHARRTRGMMEGDPYMGARGHVAVARRRREQQQQPALPRENPDENDDDDDEQR